MATWPGPRDDAKQRTCRCISVRVKCVSSCWSNVLALEILKSSSSSSSRMAPISGIDIAHGFPGVLVTCNSLSNCETVKAHSFGKPMRSIKYHRSLLWSLLPKSELCSFPKTKMLVTCLYFKSNMLARMNLGNSCRKKVTIWETALQEPNCTNFRQSSVFTAPVRLASVTVLRVRRSISSGTIIHTLDNITRLTYTHYIMKFSNYRVTW